MIERGTKGMAFARTVMPVNIVPTLPEILLVVAILAALFDSC